MSTCGRSFTHEESWRFFSSGKTFLIVYNYLAQMAIEEKWVGWNIVPKFHVMDHMLLHVRQTRENPSFTSCFCDEDFVGRIARLAARTHQTSQMERTIDRYTMLLQHICAGYDIIMMPDDDQAELAEAGVD